MKQVEDEKAFYWECVYCGKRIEEENVVFVQQGFVSGNTPVFNRSFPYHEKCYLLRNGDEECYFLEEEDCECYFSNTNQK